MLSDLREWLHSTGPLAESRNDADERWLQFYTYANPVPEPLIRCRPDANP